MLAFDTFTLQVKSENGTPFLPLCVEAVECGENNHNWCWDLAFGVFEVCHVDE